MGGHHNQGLYSCEGFTVLVAAAAFRLFSLVDHHVRSFDFASEPSFEAQQEEKQQYSLRLLRHQTVEMDEWAKGLFDLENWIGQKNG